MSFSARTMSADSADVLERLRTRQIKLVEGLRLPQVDLRNAHLQHCTIAFTDLSGADLRGAQLSNVYFSHVNLNHADLTDANLKGAILHQVTAGSARFSNSTLENASLKLGDFTRADFSAADLRKADIRVCHLERANFHQANLTHAMIIHCVCDEAQFHATNLAHVIGSGSTYTGAKLEQARNFFLNRDMVAAILQRHIDADIERAEIAGAVPLLPGWCWDAWLRRYHDSPEYIQDWVRAVFQEYPQSGCLEALLQGLPAPQREIS